MYKILISILFIFSFVSLNAQSYLNFPIDTLVKDNYYNYRNIVRYDANGKIHMVNTRSLSTNSATREIFYRTNVSGNIVTTQITNNSVDDNYAVVGFDAQNFVHIGWERRDASNNFQLIYANNRNGTFIDTTWITTSNVNKATPFMAVGKDSTAHFVYYTYATGNNNAYYRSYNFITKVLGPEVLLGAGSTGSENDIEVAVDNNNKIHIVFCTNVNINGGALKYFTNESGTLTEINTGISANGEYPDITISNTNVVNIVYRFASDHRLYVLRRTAGTGNPFDAPLAITPSGLGNPAYWRGISTDANGRLYVTYQNSTAPAPKGFFLVHGIGNTFVNPILVFEDSTGSYIGRGSSSVAAKGNGEVAITFDPTAARNGDVQSDLFLKRGTVTITSVENTKTIVKDFSLEQNYPNPFNPSTVINFNVPSNTFVKLKVYNSLGKEVELLVNENLSAGSYSVNFNASNLSGGVYFYKLETANYTETKKMILIK
ncbi:MAG: T9SS type A sorting domain-containing protein [Bacteroidetes bacterium]|nr:T9SS type A sorting domain-containing protein [Bacteroidota bacterium]